MFTVNAVKGEILLQRCGLGPALDYFDQHHKQHNLYSREFALNVVGLSHDILSLMSHKLHIDHNLLCASLFLRLVSTDMSYSMSHVISDVSVFCKTFSSIKPDLVISYIRDQETSFSPMTDKGKMLHDADILTFFALPASSIVEHVMQRTGKSKNAAINSLIVLSVNQRMHTQVGRSMLLSMSATVIENLKSILEVEEDVPTGA